MSQLQQSNRRDRKKISNKLSSPDRVQILLHLQRLWIKNTWRIPEGIILITKKEWRINTRNKLIQQFGGKCNICSSKEQLEFAHIKPTELSGPGRGTDERIRDIKSHPDCYFLLCKDCHRIYDSNERKKNRTKQI